MALRSRREGDAAGNRRSMLRMFAAPTGVAATGALVAVLVVGCGSDSDDPFGDLPRPSSSVTLPTDLPTALPTDLELPTELPSGFPTDLELPTELPSGFPTGLIPSGLLESLGVDG
nr:hypothetical protein [Micromonospora sp. DSM 115978]